MLQYDSFSPRGPTNSRLRSGHSSVNVTGMLLRFYLAFFMVVGCAPRRDPVSIEEARRMETREVAFAYDDVIRAAINVLQDMRYTIDVIDSDLGLIVASQQTEGKQVILTEEVDQEDETPTWKKILGITIIIAIVAGIIWLVTGGGDDDNDEYDDYHDDHGGTTYYGGGSGDDGPRVYRYRITLNIESLGPELTRVRLNASGELRRGNTIKEAGAVEDPAFFQRFFSGLERDLDLD